MTEKMQKNVADQLREERFTTKEDLLTWIVKEKERINDKSKTDKKHSAAFYYAYLKLLQRFYKKIENTVLFQRLEDYWYYSLGVSSSGAILSLQYTPECWINESGTVTCREGQSLPFIYVPGRFLTVEEYAEEYSVSKGTVRQWIRRGKIRSAKKTGKEWLIPELTELPGRGYQSASYQYNGHLKDIPEEYEFLQGYTVVLINQNFEDKSKFDITLAAGGKKPINMSLNTKEREKLELFLIAHPDVAYIEGPTDGLNVSISYKDYVNDWLC